MYLSLGLNGLILHFTLSQVDITNAIRCKRLDCLLKCLFRHKATKTSKLRVTGLCEGNSPETGEFPAQKGQ